MLDLFGKVPELHMQIATEQQRKPMTNYINNWLFA